jgi:hypothetical protein
MNGILRSRDFPLRTYFDELDNRARGILCDYCFYGGPSKSTLRL